jgi:cellulose synthase/poly-beta-1,6-N-acetylglucosamine synthase-like glycosyltransferase
MRGERFLFSVIIPTFIRPYQLQRCLNSLTFLDYPRDRFEVIVVDDGSKKPPDKIIDSFKNILAIKLIRQSHSGPGAARNLGASKAKGSFLAFTDDDCLPDQDWLKSLEKKFIENPACAIAGRAYNGLPKNSFAEASQELIDYLHSYFNVTPHHATFLTSNNMAVAKKDFQDIGGFDTNFQYAGGEDREFCYRWLQSGYRLIYDPEVKVKHMHLLTLRTFVSQQLYYGRGAFQLQKSLSRAIDRRFSFEKLSFYTNLLSHPLKVSCCENKITLSILFLLSQVAVTIGFIGEMLTSLQQK